MEQTPSPTISELEAESAATFARRTGRMVMSTALMNYCDRKDQNENPKKHIEGAEMVEFAMIQDLSEFMHGMVDVITTTKDTPDYGLFLLELIKLMKDKP